MDRGAWWAAVHGVAKSRTRLSDFTFTFHVHALEKEMATHSSVLAWRIPGTGCWELISTKWLVSVTDFQFPSPDPVSERWRRTYRVRLYLFFCLFVCFNTPTDPTEASHFSFFLKWSLITPRQRCTAGN